MRPLSVVIGTAIVLAIVPAFAEDDIPGQFLTREEWQQRVQAQKERIAQTRRDGVRLSAMRPPPEQDDMLRAQRALDDPDLQKGDIVSTNSGLFRYDGATSEGQRVFFPLTRAIPVRAAAPKPDAATFCCRYQYDAFPRKLPGSVRGSGDRQAYFKDCLDKKGASDPLRGPMIVQPKP